jgi:hypothetical protein
MSRRVVSKYAARSYGSFRMWKSVRASPTQPNKYVQSETETHRTMYADRTELSESIAWEQATSVREPRQCEQSVQSAQRTQ